MEVEAGSGVVRRHSLTSEEQDAARTLRDICNRCEGLQLKLNIGSWPEESQQAANHFLYFNERGELVGFAALDGAGAPEMELCGMVHPDWRRRGIGSALFRAVLAECKRRAVVTLLLICEEASASGKGFTGIISAKYESAEYHMEMDARRTRTNWLKPGSTTPVQVEVAGPSETATIAYITAASFGGPEEHVRPLIEQDMRYPSQAWYVGRLRESGQAVGSLKVYYEGEMAGIYAFGVLPEYRGRGLGREIMAETMAMLLERGMWRMALEVDVENAPALALYKSLGFETTTTYGYYRLPVPD